MHARARTEPFKAPRKKLTPEELESERRVHDHKQTELQKLVERGRAAIKQIQAREVMARSANKAPADTERAEARKAAEEQKRARQEREQKRQELVRILLHLLNACPMHWRTHTSTHACLTFLVHWW
jgi:seryl-tRNA synthetase